MSIIHIRYNSAVVRWYEAGSYDTKSPYKAICSFYHLDDDTIFIYGMHGSVTKADMANLFLELLKNNIKYVAAERRGKIIQRDIKQLLQKGRILN